MDTIPISFWEIVFRLLLSAILGGMIGLEREAEDKPAGFRTHILVCIGSSLIMLVSIIIYYKVPMSETQRADPSRIAAQVVTGIGFLGAGTILRYGTRVKGLTTAASLWTVAGIGLAVGCGFYSGALITALVVLVALVVLERAERLLIKSKRRYKSVRIECKDQPGQLGKISSLLGELRVNIRHIDIKHPSDKEWAHISLVLNIPENLNKDIVLEELRRCEGVKSVVE